MKGFITNTETKNIILAGIDQAMDARNMPRYWTTGASQIYSGEHSGLWFIPASDKLLQTKLHGKPPLTPLDFPETHQMLQLLGGLQNRVEIDPQILIDPEKEIED